MPSAFPLYYGDGWKSDEFDQLCHVLRRHPGVGDIGAGLVEERAQVTGDPVRSLFGIHLRRDRFVERCQVSIRREDPSVILREAVLLDEAGEHVLGQFG